MTSSPLDVTTTIRVGGHYYHFLTHRRARVTSLEGDRVTWQYVDRAKPTGTSKRRPNPTSSKIDKFVEMFLASIPNSSTPSGI